MHNLEGAVAARTKIYDLIAPLTLKPRATHIGYTHTVRHFDVSFFFLIFLPRRHTCPSAILPAPSLSQPLVLLVLPFPFPLHLYFFGFGAYSTQ